MSEKLEELDVSFKSPDSIEMLQCKEAIKEAEKWNEESKSVEGVSKK